MGRQKHRKSKQETSRLSIKSTTYDCVKKIKKNKKSGSKQMKGEKMREEIANIDFQFATLEEKFIPGDGESHSKNIETSEDKPKSQDMESVSGKDIDSTVDLIKSL